MREDKQRMRGMRSEGKVKVRRESKEVYRKRGGKEGEVLKKSRRRRKLMCIRKFALDENKKVEI